MAGHVRELRRLGNDVADRVDAARAGPQLRIDDDAAGVGLHADPVEIERLQPRPPSGRHQQERAPHLAVLAAFNHTEGDARLILAGAGHLDLLADRHALGCQDLQQLGDMAGIVVRHRLAALDHGDLRAQPAMCLRHLQAERARADDQQVRGERAVVEDRLVGEVRHRIEAIDLRGDGR